MNAQQKVLEYVHQHNTFEFDKWTDEELGGKMVAEGVVVERTPNSRTIARIKREGNEIVITETTRTQNPKIVNGRVETIETETVTEVLRVTL